MGRRNSQEELVFGEVSQKRPSKFVLFIVVALVVAVLALTISLVIFIVDSNRCHSEAPCTSEQCIKSAATFLDNMDQSVDPCENFFLYACGGWIKKNVIPEDRSRYSSFDALDEDVTVKCKAVIEDDPVMGEPAAISNVRKYYKSCLDIDAVNELDAKPLTDTLTAVGGWPVLGSNPGGGWSESAYRFEDLLALLGREYGTDAIISSWVGVDDKDSNVHVLEIDQPSLLLGGREYYLDANYTKKREAYTKYMTDIAVALGVSEAEAKTNATAVLEFETHIAQLSVPNAERRNAEELYNTFTLEQLMTTYTQVNWTVYYNQWLPSKTTPLPDDERIINVSPDYIGNVTEWLVNQEKRVVANYMVWRLVSAHIGELGDRFLDIRQDFLKELKGTSARSARWKGCIGQVQSSVMAFAMGRMYVGQYFPEDARIKTLDMVNNLKTAFKGMLPSNDWLEEKDKKVAADKADAMKVNVGYPDWILNDAQLDDHYKALEDFEDSAFYANGRKYDKWNLNKTLNSLREPVDKETWGMGPAEVNAYYSPNENKIVFPAGILQPPFYHKDLPWYINYGGIGVVIGHEITHGFDDEGRQFDKDGNLKAWWGDQSIAKFKERAQCIVDQYSAFVMPETGQHLNGKQTQGENIADNGGLKESLKAYSDNAKDQPSLPGMNLTEEQLFFLSYGQVWCSLNRPEGVESLILTNPHSPGRYRVIGPTQNSQSFAEAYKCKAGSYMNPKNKCQVW